MADLAIIVRSNYYIHLQQSKSVRKKINFSGFVVKAAESHFWAAEKAQ